MGEDGRRPDAAWNQLQRRFRTKGQRKRRAKKEQVDKTSSDMRKKKVEDGEELAARGKGVGEHNDSELRWSENKMIMQKAANLRTMGHGRGGQRP